MTREIWQREAALWLAQSAQNRLPEGGAIFDAPLFGVADAGDGLFDVFRREGVIGPHFIGPRQWLEGAQSVISVFLPFSAQVKKSNLAGEDPSAPWLYGRIEGQQLIGAFTRHLLDGLKQAGWQAMAPSLDAGFQADTTAVFTSNWSERHAGFAAGLGTFGLSRNLITARGAAGRMTSVITMAPWPADTRPYGEAVYAYCTRCGACIRRCPVGAITLEQGKAHAPCSARLEDTRARYAPRYGCGKCQVGVPCQDGIPSPIAK
nr:4Fe-4S binding protein [bacterium]